MDKKTNLGNLEVLKHPGIVLTLAAARWRIAAEAIVAEHNMSIIQLQILVAASELESQSLPTHQASVARWAGLEIMTTSKNVRQLESAGLVSRSVDTVDSRVRAVTITSSGQRTLKKVVKGLSKLDEELFDEIRGVQKMRKTLVAFLGKQF